MRSLPGKLAVGLLVLSGVIYPAMCASETNPRAESAEVRSSAASLTETSTQTQGIRLETSTRPAQRRPEPGPALHGSSAMPATSSEEPETAALRIVEPDYSRAESSVSGIPGGPATPVSTRLEPSETRLTDEETPERRPSSATDTRGADAATSRDPGSDPQSDIANQLPQSSGSLLSGSPVQPVMAAKNPLPPLLQLVVIAKDIQQAEAQRRLLSAAGVGIVSRKSLQNLGFVQSTFQYRSPHTADTVLALLHELDPEVIAEQNQRYRLQGNEHPIPQKKSIGHVLTNLPAPTSCNSELHIAMLDSAVIPDALSPLGNPILTYSPLETNKPPARHGTAVANLLISDSHQFPGLLKNTTLHAIGVFDRDAEGQPETRTDWIVSGLDILAGIQPAPRVVNLSFGGPYSELLESIYRRLSTTYVFVAAAGNSGTNEILYPAGYDSVIAVGAFNGKGDAYSLSNTGKHIQILGPGEDIWTRNEKGKGYYAYGTSFAAPFVSAAMLMLIEKKMNRSEYLAGLGANKHLSFKSLCGGH